MTPAKRIVLLGGTFSPARLFRAGEKGGWWDPSDLSTLFQNSNGTTAVAVGDPVGYIADKSGRGNHAIQATAAARPILRQDAGSKYYLEFDGTNDCLRVTSCVLPAYFHDWCAFDCDDLTKQMFMEHSADSNSNSGFYFYGDVTNAWQVRRDAATHADVGLANWLGTVTALAEFQYNASIQARFKNGVQVGPDTISGTLRSDSDVTDAFNICSRNQASAFSLGKLYGLIIRGGTTSAVDIARTRTWLGAKAGLTL